MSDFSRNTVRVICSLTFAIYLLTMLMSLIEGMRSGSNLNLVRDLIFLTIALTGILLLFNHKKMRAWTALIVLCAALGIDSISAAIWALVTQGSAYFPLNLVYVGSWWLFLSVMVYLSRLK